LLFAVVLLAGLATARPSANFSDALVLDDFEDASINASLWFHGNEGLGARVSESSGRLDIFYDEGADAYITANGTYAPSFNSNYGVFWANISISSDGNGETRIRVTDGTNTVNITNIPDDGLYRMYRLDFYADTDALELTINDVYNSNHSLASLDNNKNWSIQFYGESTGPSAERSYVTETWYLGNFIDLTSPSNGAFIINKEFNATISIPEETLQNATIRIWNSTNDLVNETVNILTLFGQESTSWDIPYLDVGEHTWQVYGCGDVTCLSSSNQTFTYGFVINNATFNSPVYDTSIETYTLNITFDTSLVSFATGTLVYDGSTSPGTAADIDGNYIFTVNMQVPSVEVQTVKTFNWSVFLSDTTVSDTFSTSDYQQTVDIINLSICGTGEEAVNYTIIDETTNEPVTADFDATFYYSLNRSTNQKNYSYEGTGASSYIFCIDPNEIYYTDVDIAIGASGYANRIYRLRNAEYSNATTTRFLYLLNETASSNIVIRVLDEGASPLVGYTTKIYRYQENTGNHVLVEEQVTDVFGQFSAKLIENEVSYRFEFYDGDGMLRETDDVVNIICRATICYQEFTIRKDIDDLDRFRTLENHDYSLSFNNVSNTFVFAWTDNRGEDGTTHRLVVTRYAANGTTVICDDSSTSLSNSLSCAVGDGEHAYLAQAFRSVTGEDVLQLNVLSTIVSSTAEKFGREGLFWATISLFVIIMTVLFSPVAAIILFIVALYLFTLTGIIFVPPLAIITLTAIGAFFAWAFKT